MTRLSHPTCLGIVSLSAGGWARIGERFLPSDHDDREWRGDLAPDLVLPGRTCRLTICNGRPESILGTIAAPSTHILYVNSFGGVFATRELTFSGGGVEDETVVIEGRTYTLKEAVATTADEIATGATGAELAENARNAINANGLGGYGTETTKNVHVWASSSAAVLTVTSRVGGAAGNDIDVSETLTQGSWAGATLTGGTDPTAAQKVAGRPVTLLTPYEFDYEGGDIYVHCAQAIDFSVWLHEAA